MEKRFQFNELLLEKVTPKHKKQTTNIVFCRTSNNLRPLTQIHRRFGKKKKRFLHAFLSLYSRRARLTFGMDLIHNPTLNNGFQKGNSPLPAQTREMRTVVPSPSGKAAVHWGLVATLISPSTSAKTEPKNTHKHGPKSYSAERVLALHEANLGSIPASHPVSRACQE